MSPPSRRSGSAAPQAWMLLAGGTAAAGTALLLLARAPEPTAGETPAPAVARHAARASTLAPSSFEAAPAAGLRDERGTPRPQRGDPAPAADARVAWIETALDPRASLADRSDAVRALAPLADEAAFAVLERLLDAESPGPLAALAAESLGSSPHPRAFERLAALAAADDVTLASAALRGLARTGSPQAVEILAQAIGDAARPGAMREQAMESLASLPFARTADALRSILARPETTLALEIRILEALADSTPDAAGLLLEAAASAPRPELRAAALASLGALESAEDSLAFVVPLLASEPDPRVRGKLYDVLAFSTPSARSYVDAGALRDAVLAEEDASARLRGSRLFARLVTERGDPSLADTFDAKMVPWLSETARAEEGGLAARAAVDTLRSAGTPAAAEALGQLTHAADSRVANAAARALVRPQRAPDGG